MSEETTQALTTATALPAKAVIRVGNHGLMITDLDSLWRFGSMVAKSGLAPKGLQTPEAICVAIQMGLEVGLPPLAALQNIAVINGRPALWGDAVLGVCRATGEMDEFSEWFEQGGKRLPRNPDKYTDDTVAVCRVRRRGDKEAKEVGFSVADAKRADLWDERERVKRFRAGGADYECANDSPWYCYPFRMLQFRARSFALRDKFGDALRGMRMAEDLQGGPVIDIQTSPAGGDTFVPPPKISSAQSEPEGRSEQQAPAPTRTQSDSLPDWKPAAVGISPEPLASATVPAPEIKRRRAAPAEQQQSGTPPPPGTKPTLVETPLTPQEQLLEILRANLYSFDDLRQWGIETGFLAQADSMSSIDEVPAALASRLLENKTGLLKQLQSRSAIAKGGAK